MSVYLFACLAMDGFAQVASRVLTAEEGLRFSETQLEVLKSELAATSAQLTAVQTELAQQKAG